MENLLHKHGKIHLLYKAGDNFNESGKLSTSQGDFWKLFIFHGHVRSTGMHSFQTQSSP